MRTKDETFRGTTSIRQKWRSLRLTKIRLIDNGIFRAGLVSHGQNELTIGFFGNLPGDVRRGALRKLPACCFLLYQRDNCLLFSDKGIIVFSQIGVKFKSMKCKRSQGSSRIIPFIHYSPVIL
jgi:hypothetical protein